ncbi:MAG: class II aldolase/adducin family protein [Defluviitaleaceae bacterium]|nr:class II aldolase/adducin family protein [Defluviitaleaceae bacterium]
MDIQYTHPAYQLVQIMNRIYENGMTTTSGGNLSIADCEGNIWITPASVDKGSLTPRDICCIKPDGTPVGRNLYKPSIEWPIHVGIYKRRPDLKALLHAHPPALVAFSCARTIPNLRMVDNVYRNLGQVELAAYALPGSASLGEKIADTFTDGYNVVLMENHGAMVGAADIFAAFRAFETLELIAATEVNANRMGKIRSLPAIRRLTSATMPTFIPVPPTPSECAARREMINLIRRAYRQKFFSSTQGTYSMRLGAETFLITPKDKDRFYLEESDLIMVHHGRAEAGKTPSGGVWLHKAIYDAHPDISAITGASPPCAMAFAVTDAVFDTRTIPESYIMLREVPRVSWERLLNDPSTIAGIISPSIPVLMIENSQILATGDTLIKAFDRLEVAEATARSIILAASIGEIKHISESEVDEINTAFNLEPSKKSAKKSKTEGVAE